MGGGGELCFYNKKNSILSSRFHILDSRIPKINLRKKNNIVNCFFLTSSPQGFSRFTASPGDEGDFFLTFFFTILHYTNKTLLKLKLPFLIVKNRNAFYYKDT